MAGLLSPAGSGLLAMAASGAVTKQARDDESKEAERAAAPSGRPKTR